MATAPAETGAARTRARLLDAAERLFAEHGFACTSVRDITAEAGCNVAAVNYHFGGKDKLYLETFRRRVELLREARLESIRRAVAAKDATLESVLRAFAAAFVGPLVDGPSGDRFLRLFVREMLDPRLPEGLWLQEMNAPLQGALGAAMMKTCPGLSQAAARRCVDSVIGQLVHSAQLRRLMRERDRRGAGRSDLAQLVDHVVRFSSAGIRDAAR